MESKEKSYVQGQLSRGFYRSNIAPHKPWLLNADFCLTKYFFLGTRHWTVSTNWGILWDILKYSRERENSQQNDLFMWEFQPSLSPQKPNS